MKDTNYSKGILSEREIFLSAIITNLVSKSNLILRVKCPIPDMKIEILSDMLKIRIDR